MWAELVTRALLSTALYRGLIWEQGQRPAGAVEPAAAGHPVPRSKRNVSTHILASGRCCSTWQACVRRFAWDGHRVAVAAHDLKCALRYHRTNAEHVRDLAPAWQLIAVLDTAYLDQPYIVVGYLALFRSPLKFPLNTVIHVASLGT